MKYYVLSNICVVEMDSFQTHICTSKSELSIRTRVIGWTLEGEFDTAFDATLCVANLYCQNDPMNPELTNIVIPKLVELRIELSQYYIDMLKDVQKKMEG